MINVCKHNMDYVVVLYTDARCPFCELEEEVKAFRAQTTELEKKCADLEDECIELKNKIKILQEKADKTL
jgi:peptidoglycan hydrolase CwlO-like protein